MSYLARLKQDLDQAKPNIVGNINDVGQAQERPEALAPFKGFEGSSTGAFVRKPRPMCLIFYQKRKKVLEINSIETLKSPSMGVNPLSELQKHA